MVSFSLFLRLSLTGERVPAMATSEGAENEVDHLVNVYYYHYDREDLSKCPGILDLNDAPSISIVSMHLNRVQ